MAARRALATLTRAECLKTLGTQEGTSAQALRQVFLKRAKELHPDTPTGNEEAFKRLMAAYTFLLSDKQPQTKGDMHDFDWQGYQSYQETHARHHRTSRAEEYSFRSWREEHAPEISVSGRWVIFAVLSSAMAASGLLFLVYHSTRDHEIGENIEQTYRRENARTQARFYVSQQLRARRAIDF